MNLVNLTKDSWDFGRLWNEVDLYEEQRIDGIVAEDSLLCENNSSDSDNTGRNSLLDRVIQLCCLGGVEFVLFTARKDLLYSKSGELREAFSWFQRQIDFFFEIRYVNLEAFEEKGISHEFVVLFHRTPNIIFRTSQFGYPDHTITDDFNSANDFIVKQLSYYLL